MRTFALILTLSLSLSSCWAKAQVVAPAPAQKAARVHAWVYLDQKALELGRILPDPPRPGSLEFEADLETLLMTQHFRTPEHIAWAQAAARDEIFNFAEVLGPWFSAPNLPICNAFFQKLRGDLYQIGFAAKDMFNRPRPSQVDPRIQPCIKVPKSSSYPSGHALQAYLSAALLSELCPAQKEALAQRAHRVAWSRIQGGVHFPTDDVAGLRLTQAIMAALQQSPAFRADLARCQHEVAQLQGNALLKK